MTTSSAAATATGRDRRPNSPAIDVDGDGNIWVADQPLHHVLVVSPAGEVLHTESTRRRYGADGVLLRAVLF